MHYIDMGGMSFPIIGQTERKSGEKTPLIEINMMTNERLQQITEELAVKHFYDWYGREPETIQEAFEGQRIFLEKLEHMEKQEAIRKRKDIILMKIDDIKIFSYYRDNPPKKEKFQRKVWYYAKNNRFESEIVVDRFGRLIDGYTSYIIARAYGLDEVPVRYARKEVIKAVYRPGGKEYCWMLPLSLSGRVNVGDRVKVQTSSDPQKVIVTAVEEYGTQRMEPRCMVIRICRKDKRNGKRGID